MNSPDEYEFCILTNRPELKRRAKEICDEFEYSHKVWEDIDSFLDSGAQPKILLAGMDTPEGPISPAELAQVVRHASAEAFLLCAASGSLTKDAAAFAKKSGANLVLLDDEILNTGKLEFISTQILRSKFLPIKASDLAVGHELLFDLFALLPQRRKFLKMAFTGDILDQKKWKRACEVGELYIDRSEGRAFSQYIEKTTDHSAAGIEKRCRSQFLALFSSFSKLAFQLTNQTEYITFDEGKSLIGEVSKLCSTLLGALSEGGEPWKVINNSGIGEFGSVERAPAIAAYSGVFALQMAWEPVEEIMLAAILADLGLLFLPTTTLKRIRLQSASVLKGEERERYQKYPQMSVSLILERKLQLAENVKNWIQTSQESCDGKGFPKQMEFARIPIEARLIHFCRDFDRKTLLRIGEERPNPKLILKKMVTEDAEASAIYGSDLLEQLKKIIVD